ncbi:ATP-dependent DNA helicase PcrA, partial [bacterium]|nr:ATP-dependent DNA helicase PcrA [bacterium]
MLTPAQADAIRTDCNVLVEAGAGAGKTTVLVQRYLEILQRYPDVSPSQILTITFTKKAAGELKERIQRMLSQAESNTLADQL